VIHEGFKISAEILLSSSTYDVHNTDPLIIPLNTQLLQQGASNDDAACMLEYCMPLARDNATDKRFARFEFENDQDNTCMHVGVL
jgi:hypothetical protein